MLRLCTKYSLVLFRDQLFNVPSLCLQARRALYLSEGVRAIGVELRFLLSEEKLYSWTSKSHATDCLPAYFMSV